MKVEIERIVVITFIDLSSGSFRSGKGYFRE
jgi:hypothetical protein